MSLKSNLLKELAQGPRTVKQLRGRVKADGKKIQKMLKALEKEQEVKNKKGVFSLTAASAGIVEGRLVKLGRSFGFVAPVDGSEDIFIPGHSLGGAMPGDEVTVSQLAYPRVPGSREGEIVSIQKPNNQIGGVVAEQGGRLVLLPDKAPHTPLLIRKSADGGARPGEKVAGQILERGERHDDIRIGIIQRFGAADSARQNAKAILFMHGITKAFPEAAKAQAKQVAAEKITKELLKGRIDLRDEAIFTIDSRSTKDIDDAVSAEKTDVGYRLGVHIADVSHYVQGRTPLDEEAFARGTSLYFADSVVPMLPKALSNGICSLNEGEDRLAFSCLLELDRDGRMLDYQFQKTVIRSRVKGVYDEINTLFTGNADGRLQEKYADVTDSLTIMREIYQKLSRLRVARGYMDIESEEPRLLLDEEGLCIGVEKRERGEAEKMIEEFMLQANSAAAHLARRRNIPFVYRVHEKPGAEKVQQLKDVLTALGVECHFAGATPTQTELAALLDKTRGTNLEVPVHHAVLRSMAKAKYESVPKGHFGLALSDYAHFTSPIRRYPDLAIHRILSDVVAGMDDESLQKRYQIFADTASAQSSERELLATQVERSIDDCYKAEYMKPFIGADFEGVITSVQPFGIYVGLPNTVEGLVHSSHLSDHHMELSDGVSLLDAVSGRKYRIGDAIRVKVAGVNISQGNIDFVPA